MRFGSRRFLLFAMCAFSESVYALPTETSSMPTLLGGIGNVASSATNFLVSAVEKPRNLLINATRVTTGYIDSASSKVLEVKLRRVLERFRSRMPYGVPEFGIPPLEPLTLHQVYVETDNEEIGNITLLINDLVVRHLSTFSIDRAKLSLIGPTISVNISIPEIDASGLYNISGILGNMFPLHGAGPFEATLYGFRLYVNTVLGYYRGMYMKSFDLDFSLKSLHINLNNFMGGEEVGKIMNQVFQDLTPQALEIIKPEILPSIKEYVASRVNDTIQHLTMRDLFITLLGENEIRDFAHLLIP
ncbi:uncharacterized protein [Prorops nasuta]|uniref:uncharacterized protein isoform X2 n=1 Tax=Prorops nasuta TaxID=863751 RepID=UPI0034CD4451